MLKVERRILVSCILVSSYSILIPSYARILAEDCGKYLWASQWLRTGLSCDHRQGVVGDLFTTISTTTSSSSFSRYCYNNSRYSRYIIIMCSLSAISYEESGVGSQEGVRYGRRDFFTTRIPEERMSLSRDDTRGRRGVQTALPRTHATSPIGLELLEGGSAARQG